MKKSQKSVLITEDENKAQALCSVGFFVKSTTPINNIVEGVKKIIG